MILKLKKIKLQTNNGTSLIEFVVSMSIFTTVLMATTGAYFSYSTGSRKSFASQNVIDEGRFLLDTMSKEMRSGRKFLPYSDTATNNIEFTDAENNTIKYQVENAKLGKNINSKKDDNNNLIFDQVTSDQIKVDKLNFNIIGNKTKEDGTPDDTLQPKVTISLKLSNLNDSGKSELNSSIELQTTISQRQLDN